ncbi:MAG: hypothetical protein K8T91_11015 [Planctomycetes bacterium]|nr:hypothetical protein [Planctomycetota bacterium]
MQPSLDNCWLKIERAKEHRDSLQHFVLDTFEIQDNLPRLGMKFDSDSGEYVMFINFMPDLGDFLPRCQIIVGDMMHNLISALNQLVYQLASLNTGGAIKKPISIDFPIADDAERFRDLQKRYLREVSPDHVTIIERYQGYHRIDEDLAVGTYFHPLTMLRDLASTDKHRLPISLSIPTSVTCHEGIDLIQFLIMGNCQQFARVGSMSRPRAELGVEVMRAKLPAGSVETNMDVAGHVTPYVAIDGDRPAIQTFDKIAAVVSKIIHEFNQLF